MVVRGAALVLMLVGCGSGGGGAADDGVIRERVALVPVTERRDVDLLFVLDDSIGGLEMQQSLREAFPALLAELGARSLPGLHVGAVTTDLGTRGADDPEPGPSIGSGPGSCAGEGQAALLRTNGSPIVSGSFVVDEDDGAGGRTGNYTGTLLEALATLTYFGGSGCGFEQPLEAMRRALTDQPANAGFLRPAAALGIVVLTDEDDCSFAHSMLLGPDTATLGPLQSFRCTRFGVTCDVGGATPDAMNEIGTKDHCHWADDATWLTPRSRYEALLATIKPDPRDVVFAAIAGDPAPVEVEARTPPGGGTPIPALAHSCGFNDVSGLEVADPAVRIADLVDRSPRGRFESRCAPDLSPALTGIAREIRGMLGDACLTREIALPADCEVLDQTPAAERIVPACDGPSSTDCYRLVEDPACTTSHHLRVEVARSTAPPADTMVLVRCRL